LSCYSTITNLGLSCTRQTFDWTVLLLHIQRYVFRHIHTHVHSDILMKEGTIVQRRTFITLRLLSIISSSIIIFYKQNGLSLFFFHHIWIKAFYCLTVFHQNLLKCFLITIKRPAQTYPWDMKLMNFDDNYLEFYLFKISRAIR